MLTAHLYPEFILVYPEGEKPEESIHMMVLYHVMQDEAMEQLAEEGREYVVMLERFGRRPITLSGIRSRITGFSR